MKTLVRVLTVVTIALLVFSAPALGGASDDDEFECFPFNCGE